MTQRSGRHLVCELLRAHAFQRRDHALDLKKRDLLGNARGLIRELR